MCSCWNINIKLPFLILLSFLFCWFLWLTHNTLPCPMLPTFKGCVGVWMLIVWRWLGTSLIIFWPGRETPRCHALRAPPANNCRQIYKYFFKEKIFLTLQIIPWHSNFKLRWFKTWDWSGDWMVNGFDKISRFCFVMIDFRFQQANKVWRRRSPNIYFLNWKV